jgi:hypothetical protein
MKNTAEVVRIKGAFAWVEGREAIHLKAVGAQGSPVVLDVADARQLAERLLKLAQTLENLRAEPED